MLISNVCTLRSKRVQVYLITKNETSLFQIGNRKPELQWQALDMHEICKKECIGVSPESIGRPNNIMTDALRRCGNSDSWSIKCSEW